MKTMLSLVALASAALVTQAQAAAPAGNAPPPSAYDKWEDAVKKPCDWFTWGADLRLRDEYMPNAISLREGVPLAEQNVIRYRGRIWGSATPVTNLSVNLRLSAEPREFTKPAGFGARRGRSGMEWRYGILDNANVKWANAFDVPLTITAGRQDILLGDYYDWWLVSDGTPGDGSWSFFLDSVRLNYEAKDINTKFDLIYIHQNARPGEWLPTLDNSGPTSSNPAGYGLTEQNEQGVIMYLSNKSIKNTQIDGYFIYKRDDKEFANGDNADIYTFGGKITGTPATHWQYSLEGAYQCGTKEDRILGVTAERDISAYGGKAKLTYLAKDKLNNQFSLMGEILSGDDPSTPGKDEMFDLLWGRWPRWSELYIYSYAGETSGKIAQMNNIVRFGPSWTFSPMKGMSLSVVYNAMLAPEETPTRAVAPRFSNNGNFRGHYVQAILKHQFNKHWSAHLWAEVVWEGDYYAQRDMMMFLRPEIMFTF